VLPPTIDGIRAHFGNPTQITLLRMPVCAGSPHEKTVHNGGSARGYQELPQRRQFRPRPSRQAAGPYVYALPALGVVARFCRRPGVAVIL